MNNKVLESNISSACGEYYVLSQLLRNNYVAYLSHGTTQKGWDILVFQNDKSIKIQVKTVQWKESSKTIQGNFEDKDFDILVVVILNRKSKKNKIHSFDSLIIHKDSIKAKKGNKKSLFNENGNICYKNKTISLNTLYAKSNETNFKKYKNKWKTNRRRQMPKTIKFNLILDGKPVRDIEGLQENFCIDDVLAVYENGLLERWLKVRGFDDYSKKINKIKKDDGIIKQLIKIFGIEKSEKEIMEGIYSLSFWNERKIEIEEWLKKDNAVKQIVADYHNGYKTLKQQTIEHKFDMPFLKQSTKEIYKTYFEIFKIDYKYFFYNFLNSVPLMIFAVLMNKNLRKIFLIEESIRADLSNIVDLFKIKETNLNLRNVILKNKLFITDFGVRII
ncbi:MAG: hypothetical protein K8S23_10285 [Candidatus Cloacimonetes bacterium]|nr:hypothetical protein [Candidatus Cloacimonadota bacterium]